MIINITGKLEINHRTPAWCKLPYPGHKKGCPNCEECKKLPGINEYFDLSKRHWFAIETFDLQKHITRMKSLHPQWSLRQCRCVLYWQGRVKKDLKKQCNAFIAEQSLIYHLIPEAMGVNVLLTMKRIGQQIEIKPQFTVKKIALIGAPGTSYKKKRESNARTRI